MDLSQWQCQSDRGVGRSGLFPDLANSLDKGNGHAKALIYQYLRLLWKFLAGHRPAQLRRAVNTRKFVFKGCAENGFYSAFRKAPLYGIFIAKTLLTFLGGGREIP